MNIAIEDAIRLHQQSHLEEAERAYAKMLETDDRNVDALHYLGVLRHQRGASQEAIDLVGRALALNPHYIDAHVNLGNIHRETGNDEAARDCYARALELDPNHAGALGNLGTVLNTGGDLREAYAAGRRAVELDPDAAGHWVNLGSTLLNGGQLTAAMDCFRAAIERSPHLTGAYIGLCRALYTLECREGYSIKHRKELADVYRRWLAEHPDSSFAGFMLAACEGQDDLERCPDEFVRASFDDFARHFERKLEKLEYCVPSLIEGALRETTGPKRYSRILDAGCGTGLCAPFLREWGDHLVGVDLSSGMLAEAARRQVYDQLLEDELTRYLESGPAPFDLVVCADTLCYFGDLHRIIQALGSVLAPGGRLLFTVERSEHQGPAGERVLSSGRFAHREDHVLQCLDKAGLHPVQARPDRLRNEGGQPVMGLLVDAYPSQKLK
ncbi:tetratricopeptide repeat protein [Marinihelvus fidelis]|uniref:Tetratricopeptide repeat protein n=1 Tax=Marinihelvus fidelis TaxID=2613842 RepID=A0A5N0TFH4_9GAMM|nr:tetratricopeptide repeat protein [Marinihelvus fidelis]KAA9132626.1 tetratricopeptide repeat protein [Marinihelvus fidelis]